LLSQAISGLAEKPNGRANNPHRENEERAKAVTCAIVVVPKGQPGSDCYDGQEENRLEGHGKRPKKPVHRNFVIHVMYRPNIKRNRTGGSLATQNQESSNGISMSGAD
jgi:hypothetical protein